MKAKTLSLIFLALIGLNVFVGCAPAAEAPAEETKTEAPAEEGE
jgi:hypothetical protein